MQSSGKLTRFVAKFRHEPSLCQSAHCLEVGHVDNDRLFHWSLAQIRDDTIAAGRGVLHHTGIAIDGHRVVVAHVLNTTDGV